MWEFFCIEHQCWERSYFIKSQTDADRMNRIIGREFYRRRFNA